MGFWTPIIRFHESSPRTGTLSLLSPGVRTRPSDFKTTDLEADFEAEKSCQSTFEVVPRSDGWWVVDPRQTDAAGPFQTLAEVEEYLDWHDNQRIASDR